MRRPLALLGAALFAATLPVVTAPPAHAVGETFRVLAVQTPGCATGNFAMLVERANLDGGPSYTVHTVVTVAGKIYMNESASISSNGQTGWNLFNNFTYGPVPNPGVWPMPQDSQVRINFTLERPVGTVLWDWTTVVDACNTGTMLYNGRTSADVDQDMVTTVSDKCPSIYGDAANGCPDFSRTLGLKYVAKAKKFKGKLKAVGAPPLRSGQTVSVWKVQPGPDKMLGQVTTTATGGYTLTKKGKPGKYYATVDAALLPATGQSAAASSPKIKVP